VDTQRLGEGAPRQPALGAQHGDPAEDPLGHLRALHSIKSL
jgi:hypothetical protein